MQPCSLHAAIFISAARVSSAIWKLLAWISLIPVCKSRTNVVAGNLAIVSLTVEGGYREDVKEKR